MDNTQIVCAALIAATVIAALVDFYWFGATTASVPRTRRTRRLRRLKRKARIAAFNEAWKDYE